jgi:glycosyltransferase involved in cell wall biosynthesis
MDDRRRQPGAIGQIASTRGQRVISVLVLTFNEEVNIGACLASVSWSDDVVVFDSFSTDRTVELARAAGARVVQHAFDDYGKQRERALRCGLKHSWVLVLDADERVEPGLAEEMRSVVGANPGHAAYRMLRRDYFFGKWIKHATLYPSWFVRLLRHERARYEDRSVHEYPTVDGSVGELRGHLAHYSFNKGLGEWVAKHNRYAEHEAREALVSLAAGRVDWGGLLAGDPVRRRRALKGLSYRLPFRPTLRFWYMYVLRGAWLDGWAGLTYCRLLRFYEYLIVLKMRESRRRERGAPV